MRPVTVDSHASKRGVLSSHLKRQEGEFMPTRSGLDNRWRLNNDTAEGNGTRGGGGMIANDDDGGDVGNSEGSGRTPPFEGKLAQRGTLGDGSNWRGESAAITPNISQDAATMLQRSHALVARAKVSGSFNLLRVLVSGILGYLTQRFVAVSHTASHGKHTLYWGERAERYIARSHLAFVSRK